MLSLHYGLALTWLTRKTIALTIWFSFVSKVTSLLNIYFYLLIWLSWVFVVAQGAISLCHSMRDFLVASPMSSHLWPLRSCSLSGAQERKVGRKQWFPHTGAAMPAGNQSHGAAGISWKTQPPGGHLLWAPWRAWRYSLLSGREDSATQGLFVPLPSARVICWNAFPPVWCS